MATLAACQRPGGAFLKTGTGKVLSCVQTPATAVTAGEKAKKGKKEAAPAAAAAASASSSAASAPSGPTFDVILSDSVLFAAGGGQPTDTGALVLPDGDRVRVLDVSRTPAGVVHRVERAVPVDVDVTMEIDWDRRFDHMTQHSSQHLISAVARSSLGFNTLSWWLASAPQECHIELDTGAGGMSSEQIVSLERSVNDWIRRGTEMKLHTFDSLAVARTDPWFQANVSKSIPDTQEGPIRVIEIPELEWNPCCGTHLSNTAQMQSISLTRVEKGKTSCKLFFLAGDRVQQALRSALDIQRCLTGTLCCAPELFDAQVKRMQTELKGVNRQLGGVLKELAESDAAKMVASLQSGAKVAQLHRDEFGLNYIASVAELVSDTLKAAAQPLPSPFLLLLSSSDAPAGAAGAFILTGDEGQVSALGAELATMLQGKGGGRKGKFQGKASGLDAKSRAAAFAWLQAQL